MSEVDTLDDISAELTETFYNEFAEVLEDDQLNEARGYAED